MSVPTVRDLRRPPHDPLTLVLGGRLGWPSRDPAPGPSLQLRPFPDSVRLLTEASGSLGGLRPPANVAVSDTGDVWVLTRDGRLLRFDACACGFTRVPCVLGGGSGLGQLSETRGIAVAAGHLFVCDGGNQRVQVVLTPAMVVSATWQPPMAWRPTAVAVDRRLRVHVTDPLNGMVHHFGWSGRYRGATPGTGDAQHIAVLQDGSLLVAGPSGALRITADEGRLERLTDLAATALAGELPPSPFEVSADGSLHLGPHCATPDPGLWFTSDGAPTAPPTPPAQAWEQHRDLVIGPLDSEIDECVWDRLTLEGDLPATTSVSVESFTAHVPLTDAELATVPPSAWDTKLVCAGLEQGAWDGLLRSPGGRYLWLRIGLTGNGQVTPRIDGAVVDYPRISLRRYLPAVFGAEPTSADFTDRLLALFDRSLREVERRVDDLPALLDAQSTPALDWLAGWIGVRPDHRMPEQFQRDMVVNAGQLMDLRGTVTGLRRLLVLALGLDRVGKCACDRCAHCMCPPPRETCPPRPVQRNRWAPPPLVLEHFRLRRWFEAGAARLGDCTVLWGQSILNRSQLDVSARVGRTALDGAHDPVLDPFQVHAHRFTVFVPANAGRTQERRRALEQLVAWGSPAQAQGFVEYVEPRLRVGIQASVGLNTVVAGLPAGVTLGDTRLGAASVLEGSSRQSIDTSAVGTTAVLG